MIQNLENRMEKMQESTNKDLEEIKQPKTQLLQMKNMSSLKTIIDGNKRRLNIEKKRTVI